MVFLSALGGCKKESEPTGLYTLEEMIPVVKDMQIGYAGVDVTVALQEEKEKKYDELNLLILERHKMDKDRFFRTFQWFERHPDMMDKMYSQIIDELTQDLDGLQKEISNRPVQTMPNNNNNGQPQPTN